MYKLVIFDLDGTLLDTIEDICDSINIALKESNLELVTIEECKYMVGNGAKILVERAIREKTQFFDKVFSSYMFNYERLQKNKTRPYEKIMEVLDRLKELNIKSAILSNKPHEDTLRVVDYYFGLSKFDLVIGKKPNNRPKPEIDGAIEILNTLNMKSEDVLYVGDTSVDITTAIRSNFTSVGVTWGFRKESELTQANYIIHHPLDLLRIIEEK